uniref:Uncharacterized protein n=1 Tax=Medicago truncatula TaxID=3880 RepID=B7FMX1_MEDTR|nr:unknown [Medicago truncatula]
MKLFIYLFKWLNFIKTCNYTHKTYCRAPKHYNSGTNAKSATTDHNTHEHKNSSYCWKKSWGRTPTAAKNSESTLNKIKQKSSNNGSPNIDNKQQPKAPNDANGTPTPFKI